MSCRSCLMPSALKNQNPGSDLVRRQDARSDPSSSTSTKRRFSSSASDQSQASVLTHSHTSACTARQSHSRSQLDRPGRSARPAECSPRFEQILLVQVNRRDTALSNPLAQLVRDAGVENRGSRLWAGGVHKPPPKIGPCSLNQLNHTPGLAFPVIQHPHEVYVGQGTLPLSIGIRASEPAEVASLLCGSRLRSGILTNT